MADWLVAAALVVPPIALMIAAGVALSRPSIERRLSAYQVERTTTRSGPEDTQTFGRRVLLPLSRGLVDVAGTVHAGSGTVG